MEDIFLAIMGMAFIMIVPAIFIIGFGIAVGIATAIPPVLITLLIFVLDGKPKGRKRETLKDRADD